MNPAAADLSRQPGRLERPDGVHAGGLQAADGPGTADQIGGRVVAGAGLDLARHAELLGDGGG